MVGQIITGAAYPLNWILFLMPLQRGWIMLDLVNWYWVVIHYMAALFCFFLLRDLKRGFAASLLGSVAFAAGGYLATIAFPQMQNGAVWTPLVFLFALRDNLIRPMIDGVKRAPAGASVGSAAHDHRTPTENRYGGRALIVFALCACAVWWMVTRL